MDKVIQWIKKYQRTMLYVLVGALLGFAYWYFIGCTSGTCPIQSNWHTSTLYGALFGFILSGSCLSGSCSNGSCDTKDNKKEETK